MVQTRKATKFPRRKKFELAVERVATLGPLLGLRLNNQPNNFHPSMPLHIGFFYSTKRHANRWYSALVTTNHPLCFVIQISSQGWKTTWKESFIIFLSEEMEVVCDNLRDYSGVISTLNIKLGGGGVPTSFTLPLDPPEYIFWACAPKCNRTEIMLDVNETS